MHWHSPATSLYLTPISMPSITKQHLILECEIGYILENRRYPWGNRNDLFLPIGWVADLEGSDDEGVPSSRSVGNGSSWSPGSWEMSMSERGILGPGNHTTESFWMRSRRDVEDSDDAGEAQEHKSAMCHLLGGLG